MAGSFGDLLAKAGLQGSSQAEEAPEAEAAPTPEEPSYGPKLVLRMTRKGRGGRTVTVLQGVTGGREQLAALLKKQLGVGARVEEEELVLQGDQVERVARWLEGQEGVRKVVRG
jgi:translation initiation factor 1